MRFLLSACSSRRAVIVRIPVETYHEVVSGSVRIYANQVRYKLYSLASIGIGISLERKTLNLASREARALANGYRLVVVTAA